MSSGSILTLRHIFGLKGDVKDNIHYIDESTVLYPAGYNVVVYNTEKKTQKFLPLASAASAGAGAGAPGAGGAGADGAAAAASSSSAAAGLVSSGDISAMAVCNLSSAAVGHGPKGSLGSGGGGAGGADGGRVKSKILAVAERGESGKASVSVFDLVSFKRRGKAAISSPEVASSEFVCLAFSPDGKYLLTQGGAPDWTLINWQWEKGKALQIAKVSNQSGAVIHQCSYCPTDPSVVCVTGNGILRFLHIEQNEFKSIPFSMGKREPQNYLSHCWIDDRILVGTDSGDILVFENAEFRGVLESSPAGGKSIDCIAAFSKGFVIGMDEGYLMTFDRDDKEIYKYAKSFQIDGNFVKVKSLAIAPSEENVICTLENNQAYVLGLSHSDLLKSEEMNFEPLALPFHHMHITGMDVCIRKPLVVTCGADRSVRIWNYLSRTVEVTRFFNEQPHSVAFHPQGLMILVGFTDNLRLLNILMDDVQPFRDFAIKGCKEVQFSNGGQYFAAANGSVIQVFATYTCEMLGSFNVHKAKVRSIAWTPDDSGIVSAGMDGCVFSTRIATGEHAPLAKHKCNYTSAVPTADGKVYAVGSDRHLKVISDGALQAELNCGVVLTQLCTQMARPPLKDRFLFAGTDTGVVRVFPIPVEGKCYDQQVHTGAITRVRCTPDDNWLLTAGEDGCLSIFAIEQKRDAATRGRHGGGATGAGGDHTLQWADEVQVPAEDLKEKLAILADLQAKVTELKERNDTTLMLKDAAFKDKLRETSERFNSELEGDKQRYALLEEQKEQLEKSYASKVEQLNALHKSKMRELQEHHDHKMQQEDERRADFEQRIKAQRAQFEAELAELEEKCIAEKNTLSDEYEAKISEARQLKIRLLLEREQIRAEMSEATSAMEADADGEIDEIKAAYDKKLMAERMQTLHLKDENSIQKRKFGNVREDITENLDDLERMRDKHQALYDTIDSLEKDIKGHVKEIKERESTIADKRHRIFELKKKNQELEKFKFVLDYKITELKRQIQPRKIEMKQLSQQIGEMEKELRAYKKESADLQLDVTELNLKSNGMEANIAKEARSREEVAAHLSHVKTELHEVFQEIDNPKKLKDGIKRLYQRHVQNAAQMQEAASRSRLKEEAAAQAAQAAQAASASGGAGGVSSSAPSAASSSSGFKASAAAAVDDVHNDYQRQRHYLERSIDSHNAKCKKDMRVHIKEHTRIMQENIALTKEVNELRREKYHILVQQKSKDQLQAKKGTGGAGAGAGAGAGPGAAGGPSGLSQRGRMSRTLDSSDSASGVGLGSSASASMLAQAGLAATDETEIQQEQIRALKKQLSMLESEYQELVTGAPPGTAGGAANAVPGGSASARSHAPAPAGSLSSRSLHSGDKLPQLSFRGGAGGSASVSQRDHDGGDEDDMDDVNASLATFTVDDKGEEHKEF